MQQLDFDLSIWPINPQEKMFWSLCWCVIIKMSETQPERAALTVDLLTSLLSPRSVSEKHIELLVEVCILQRAHEALKWLTAELIFIFPHCLVVYSTTTRTSIRTCCKNSSFVPFTLLIPDHPHGANRSENGIWLDWEFTMAKFGQKLLSFAPGFT